MPSATRSGGRVACNGGALQHRQRVRVKVRALNYAGLESAVVSDVVTVAKMKRSFLAKEHWERLVFGHPPVDTVRIPTSLKQEFED